MTVIKQTELEPYLEAGYFLIPLCHWDFVDARGAQRGKSPRDPRWLVAPYQPADIARAISSGANIGVRLSETQLVIDYDPRNDPSNGEVLTRLAAQFGLDLDACPQVRTGSGGLHFYLRLPVGVRVVNGIEDYLGVEFKSFGRQVVSAGSKHPNGSFYSWDICSPPLTLAPAAPDALLEAIRRPEKNAPVEGGEVSVEQIERCLALLDPTDFQGHDKWLSLMMSCHSGTSGDPEAREAFIAWSTRDPRYAADGDQIRYRWNSLRPDGGVTIGTLYGYITETGRPVPSDVARDFDDMPEQEDRGYDMPLLDRLKDGRPRPTRSNAIRALQALRLSPEWDVLHNRVVLQGHLGLLRSVYPDATDLWNENLLHALGRLLIDLYSLEIGLDTLGDAIRAIAIERPFDPIRRYLESLKWDGVPRLNGWLATYARAEASPYTDAVGRLMLLGAVGRVMQPGIKYDTMVVLESEQGKEKSSMLRVLGGEWTLEGLPPRDLASKDVVDAIRTSWIVEIEELDSMRRADVNTLKAFLSRTVDRTRLPYERTAADFPRRTVFIGTTNDKDYLRDMTGNRRFLPVRVGQIDLSAVRRDRDQLFAEAVQEWLKRPAPEVLMLSRDLWSTAADEQEQRRAVDGWEVAIESMLAKLEDTSVDRLSVQTILFEALRVEPAKATSMDTRRLRQIMERLGWNYTRYYDNGVRVRGYQRADG